MLEITWWPESALTELTLLGFAFVLSAVIGLERQRQMKSAGLRTHTLVGLGAALFTLVSAYGFDHVLGPDVILDPSRIAAQVVSGIGFLGAGVIFVRRDAVSGLTTAASIWMTAAIGMACGAGMPLIAVIATALHLMAVTVLTVVGRRVPGKRVGCDLRVRYSDQRGVLRTVLEEATVLGYETALRHAERYERRDTGSYVEAVMTFHHRGRSSADVLLSTISEIDGVVSVQLNEREND